MQQTNSTPMTPEERAKQITCRIEEYLGPDLEFWHTREISRHFQEYEDRCKQLEAQLAETRNDSDLVRALNESQAAGMAKLWSIIAPGYEGDLTIHEYCQKLVSDLQVSLKAQDQAETERDHYAALAAQRGEALRKEGHCGTCDGTGIMGDKCDCTEEYGYARKGCGMCNGTGEWEAQCAECDGTKTTLSPESKAALESTDAEQWLAQQIAKAKAEELDRIITEDSYYYSDAFGPIMAVEIEDLRDRADEIRKEAGIA